MALDPARDNPSSTRQTMVLVAAISVLTLVVLTKAIGALHGSREILFSHDDYFLIEAGRQRLTNGIGKVSFFPNSAQGWDIFAWPYYLPTYLYAALLRVWDLRYPLVTFVHLAQFVLHLALVAAFFRRFVPLPTALAVTAIVFLDPVFAQIAGEHFNLMAMSFGLLSLLAYDFCTGEAERPRSRSWCAAAAGATAAAAVFSFPAIGIPIVSGVAAAFVWDCVRSPHRRQALQHLFAFGSGGAIVLAAFLVDAGLHLDAEHRRALLTMVSHPYTAEAEGGAGNAIVRAGYLLAGMIVSPRGPTLVPVGVLAAIILSLTSYRGADSRLRRLIRLALLLSAAWAAWGVLIPHHISAPRMAALLPIHALVLLLAWRQGCIPPGVVPKGLGAAAGLAAVGLAYHALGQPAAPYGVGIAAAAALLLAASAWLVAGRGAALPRPGILLLGLVLAVSPLLTLTSTARVLASVTDVRAWQRTVPLFDQIAPEVRRLVAPMVRPGERVLTNMAAAEFFPPGTKLQLVRFYRGLFNGATASPAELAVMIGETALGNSIYPGYPELGVGASFQFRGFAYCVTGRVAVHSLWYALLATPGTCSPDANLVLPDGEEGGDVPGAQVRSYLDWRRSLGLPTQ